MKYQFRIIILSAVVGFSTIILSSCNKEEDNMQPPTIEFKTGGSYTSADATLPAGSAVTIGITAEKSQDAGESEDVLKHFNISKSVNGATATSVYDVELSADEEELYEYDFNTNVSTTIGDTEKYTFTITNRDGLTGQVSLTITAQ